MSELLKTSLTRRAFSLGAAATCLAGAASARTVVEQLKASPCAAIPVAGESGGDLIRIERRWKGPYCSTRVGNRGKRPVRLAEIRLFTLQHDFPPETPMYGESFQMLSQTAGTAANPLDLAYSERKHYRIPQPEDAHVVHNLLMFAPPGRPRVMLAFTSSKRFSGRFFVRAKSSEVVVDTEGLSLGPGESWELEEFCVAEGASRDVLLESLAARLKANHPPLAWKTPPTGWCSWYCFGPKVTAANVTANLDAIERRFPGLRYIQIDDGYQPAMGDWLEPGPAFGGDLPGVLKEIRRRGFEPAIWVAPFIAEAKSKVFEEHPEWFIQAQSGGPLRSDTVSFGGWRHGPWYALDGTHPEVQRHFERLFRTMREEWGCTYFKLDANFWGALHGGRFHDARATRVQAYRSGMQAILRGSKDAFILGCNHPMWPSLGVIHGSRSSGDISRRWRTIRGTARENLLRGWQNGSLWWNDPDAVVLAGNLPLNEFLFHATVIYACGGMILSGDDLSQMPPDRAALLDKLLPPTGVAAKFEDESLTVGRVATGGVTMLCLFNWDDEPRTVKAAVPAGAGVRDFWSGEAVSASRGGLQIELPARSARLLRCEKG